MEWRYYCPVILAVIMFLLVGTVFERRIEAAIRRIIAHQQAYLRAHQVSRYQDSTTTDRNVTYHSKSATEMETKKIDDITSEASAERETSGVTITWSKKSLSDTILMQSKSVPEIKMLKKIYSTQNIQKPLPTINICNYDSK